MDVIRQFSTVDCSDNLVQSISTVDKYLNSKNESEVQAIMGVFGLEGLGDVRDFASTIEVRFSVCLHPLPLQDIVWCGFSVD